MIILVWRKHQFFSGCFFHIDWPAYSLAHSDNHKMLMVLQQIAISETLCVVTIFFIPILTFGCSRRNGLIEFGNGFEQNPVCFMQLHLVQGPQARLVYYQSVSLVLAKWMCSLKFLYSFLGKTSQLPTKEKNLTIAQTFLLLPQSLPIFSSFFLSSKRINRSCTS